MNLTAPPPAKKQATASGLSCAISASTALKSVLGNGTFSSFTMLPPALT